MFSFLCCEGRYPRIEIRKINSQGLKEISQAFTVISSGKKDLVVAEDLLDISEEKIGHNQFPSELSSNMVEDSVEERKLLHLFVYGVRYDILTSYGDFDMI